LHRRASEWYEQNELPADAIRHALAAEDYGRAAGLVELAWPAMDASFQFAVWLGWAKALPDELVRARPVLSAGYTWALFADGELDAGEARLRDAERWLEALRDSAGRAGGRPAGMVVADEEQSRSLPVTIANARAYYAQSIGDGPASIKYARRALDLLPEENHFGRGRAAVILGLVYWANGDLEAARRSFADAKFSFQMAGNILFAISFTFIQADIMIAQGRLREALSIYEQSMQLVTEAGELDLPEVAELQLGLSELHRERGELEAAREHLQRSEALGEQGWVYRHRLCLVKARIKEAQGDLDGALDLLDQAERLYSRGPIPDVRPVAALKTRVWVGQGRLDKAQGWVRERGLSADDDLTYLREFEHITLARVLIARYRSDRAERPIHQAVGLLERLLRAAQEGGRTGSAIEILLLQALAYEAQGDVSRALVPLERALALAEPEGYVRVFVDQGPPMEALLREATKHGIAPNYVRQLRAAFGKAAAFGKVARRESVTQPLFEPLTERELEVLGLLGSELNGPEIARELVVSLNTMRTHTKNIYSKLGVNNREAAVRRAEELDLL
jgi:LuxR family maltose regulon positive regulatory protein